MIGFVITGGVIIGGNEQKVTVGPGVLTENTTFVSDETFFCLIPTMDNSC